MALSRRSKYTGDRSEVRVISSWGYRSRQRAAGTISVALLVAATADASRASSEDAVPPFRLLRDFLPYENHSDRGGEESITHMVGAGVCVLDYDGDGVWDLFLPDKTKDVRGGGSRLFRGGGGLSFEDVTQVSGIDDAGWSVGCSVADVDNDGDPDLYVTRLGRNGFFRNRGDGTFAPDEAFGDTRESWSTGAAFSDLDLDGFVDLYVCNYIDLTHVDLKARCPYYGIEVFCGPNGLPGAPDVLYRSESGVTFQDETMAAGIEDREGRGFSVLLANLDEDRLPDIHVANDAGIDRLYANRGGFRFEDVSLLSGAGYSSLGMEQSGMGSTAGDFDEDGDEDLYVTNFQRDYNTLFRNDGALTFQDVTTASGLALPTVDRLAWGAMFLDVGNDGALDLFVANGHIYPELAKHPEVGEPYAQAPQLFRGDGRGHFREQAIVEKPPKALGRGTALADLDGDGALDVVVNNLGGAPDLYLGGDSPGNWIRLRLVGARSNRDGWNAVLIARTATGTKRRELRGSDGFLGSNESVLHLGLGDSETPAELEVRWPSGVVDRCSSVANRETLIVKEGIGCLPSYVRR